MSPDGFENLAGVKRMAGPFASKWHEVIREPAKNKAVVVRTVSAWSILPREEVLDGSRLQVLSESLEEQLDVSLLEADEVWKVLVRVGESHEAVLLVVEGFVLGSGFPHGGPVEDASDTGSTFQVYGEVLESL